MTDQSHPVGDPVRAFRQTLARAHRAEAEVRRLRQLLAQEQEQQQ